jgi:two-component system sensor histidine kinase YesM
VLDYGENIVELRRELQNVEDYFDLIQVRYEDRVNLLMKVDSDVSLDWGILKLSIQPFIENAVQHGILPKDDGGRISLEIAQEDGDALSIRIIDDGVGMNAEKVQELNQTLNGKLFVGGGKQIGLKNVHDRVQSLFGHSFGIVINSIPNVGTSVHIRLPIIKEVDNPYAKRNTSG